jgi:Carboxypeptidase regulatory-like domain
MTRITTVLLITALAAVAPRGAFALIRGDAGNKPVSDPGWPAGATTIFNHAGRAAWWEGPPFGGGQWHAECRGDAKALSAVLADFAKLDVKAKRIYVHDGAGYSFWLAPNKEPEKLAAAKIDWVFMVWQSANWERLRKLPADLDPTEVGESSPPSRIDVYTGGLPWADVTVPKGIEVVDQRLLAHGFTTADGVVIEGSVTDLSTKQPITATIQLQQIRPQEKGGYLYPVVAETKSDAQGHWVLKKAPAFWVRVVVVDAKGFVPRVAGYAQFDDQPRWQSYDCALARPAPVSGRILDEDGKPLSDVVVRLDNVLPASGGRYESPAGYTYNTDAEGRFRAEAVPAGTATIWPQKPGYCRPGLGLPITTPKDGVELKLMKSCSVRVTVDFTGKDRPAGYNVKIEPEGGETVGTYGGSGNINVKNQISFEDVPPGRYVLRGRPNPGSSNEEAEPVTVELKGGQAFDVTLKAM